MKTNPCNKCLVKPCCTDLCNQKHEYTHELNGLLCNLAKQVFKKNGKRKKWRASNLLNSTYDEVIVLHNRNSYEYNKILTR
jgi:hypothetical protein